MMEREVQSVTSELRRRLQAVYGERLLKLMLFGSHARGDAEDGSDIDVLLVLKGPVSPCEEIERTVEHTADISLRHDVVVSCVFVSEDQFERERSPLLLNVRREGVAI